MSPTLVPAAWTLLAAQLAHLVVSIVSAPPEEDVVAGEGVVGAPLGLLAIVANVVVLVGLRRRRSWAPTLAAVNGFGVAVGFLVYHGLPFHSWATNPYWDAADAVDWLGVAVCVVAGAWCAWAGWPRARRLRAASP
jgi:hypothetical protein